MEPEVGCTVLKIQLYSRVEISFGCSICILT
jgi:hypothetical protein